MVVAAAVVEDMPKINTGSGGWESYSDALRKRKSDFCKSLEKQFGDSLWILHQATFWRGLYKKDKALLPFYSWEVKKLQMARQVLREQQNFSLKRKMGQPRKIFLLQRQRQILARPVEVRPTTNYIAGGLKGMQKYWYKITIREGVEITIEDFIKKITFTILV